MPSKNIRKPLVFCCFQGVKKETSGTEQINYVPDVIYSITMYNDDTSLYFKDHRASKYW